MTSIPYAMWLAMLRADFMLFVKQVMAELEPGTNYEENWHLEVIARALLEVQCGTSRRLMINLPPRSMKTILVSIAFPAWLLGHDPTRRILCMTYSQEVAKAQGILFTRVVRSSWYRDVFPDLRQGVPSRTLEWHTTVGGCRIASSMEGSVLGRGADYIILDDPNKGQEIHSKVARQKVLTSWDGTISTRRNHYRECAVICVMQRLHADDLAGHMLEQEDYDHILIQAVATQEESWPLLGGRTWIRHEGEPIQPSRMDHPELELQRRIMGGTAYAAQYQQQPVPADGLVIKRSWLRYYDEAPETFETILVSWDTASTLSENSDWSVGTVWGLQEGEIYLLDVVRRRIETPDLTHLVEQVHRTHHADITLVESAGLGLAVVQNVRRTSRICQPIAVNPHIDKVARMQARAVMFETGKVLLPREAPWLQTYLEELLGFPNARHDDQVDATSQALDWFQALLVRDLRTTRPDHKRPKGNKRPRGSPRPRRGY